MRAKLLFFGAAMGAWLAFVVLSGCAAPPLEAVPTPAGVQTTQQSRVFDSPAMFNAKYADHQRTYSENDATLYSGDGHGRSISSIGSPAWYQYRNDVSKRVYAGYRGPVIESSRVRTYDHFGSTHGHVQDHYRRTTRNIRVRVQYR